MMSDNNSDVNYLLDNNKSLIDILDGSGLDASEEYSEPNLLQNSPFCDSIKFIDILSQKHGIFSAYSLNCQSLNAKHEMLKTYIEMYNCNATKLSALCLQETWLSTGSDTSLIQLEGYNLIHNGKSCSAHGGVAIYLHESYQYEILDFCNNSDVFDKLFIKISVRNGESRNKHLILGTIYRPPRQNRENIQDFLNELGVLVNDLRNFKDVVITGDFNLDLLKFKENTNVNDFFEFMVSNSYLPKITLPTRLTNRRGTLIDNFFVKISENFSNTTSGILLDHVSDHQPYFITLDYLHVPNTTCKRIKLVPSDILSFQSFKTDLQSNATMRKLNSVTTTEPNSSYQNLHNILKNLTDTHFPIKYVKFNKYKHKKSPWITNGILKSISFKDKLYGEYYESRLTNFRTYNKILRQMINAAKKSYYQNCFYRFKGDIKKTWCTINDIINNKKRKDNFQEYFELNGNKITNKKEIADQFNTFFVNLGPNLAEQINYPPGRSYKDYLNDPATQKFEFRTVSSETVIKVINSLKPKSSQSLDRISNKLLKYIKDEIAGPLTNIINQSIQQGIFPNLLKQAKVIPLYKKDEPFLFCNYRPISILSSVSQVFERILYNQMYEYFS
jgi:hypothetical protein